MCGQAGLKVLRLKRVREGGLCLDRTLGPGKWRRLEQSEVAAAAKALIFCPVPDRT